jgi:UDPglucose 6-dehydrogenase
MKVGVIGQGYVGLVTSACLAAWGHDVVGAESNRDRLAALSEGHAPFVEPGLDDLLARGIASGKLSFVSSAREAAAWADAVIVAVGTHDGNGGWQTETMLSCLADVLPGIADDGVLVIRSTLPPDFIRQLPGLLRSLRAQAGRTPIPSVLNPEFTREGSAVRDFTHADRVVIGAIDDPAGAGAGLVRKLYDAGESPVLEMSAIDAAFAKLGANLFLATKISFANELARLCDAYGASVDRVVETMAYDGRIGGRFLKPGVGFGGSCLPHQVTMTVRSAALAGIPSPLLAAVDEINHRQRVDFVERISDVLGGSVKGTRVAMLGLTFKPFTDDLRDAPSMVIAARLLDEGAEVVAYDPMPSARQRFAEAMPGVQVVDTALAALEGADAAALVTEWPEFLELDWSSVQQIMKRPVIADGRGALQQDLLTQMGYDYVAFGRGVSTHEAEAEAVAAFAIDGIFETQMPVGDGPYLAVAE